MILQNQDQVFLQGQPAVVSSGPPPPPPAAPSNLDIDANNSDLVAGVILNWTNNWAVPAATTNQIWTSTNGGPYVFLASVAGNVTTYTDLSRAGAAPGDYWQYKVRAMNGSSPSAFSNDVAASNSLGNRGDTTYNYPTMIVIFNGFETGASGLVTSVNMPLLRTIQTMGDFTLSGESSLTVLNLPALNNVQGNMFLNDCSAITSLNFPALQNVAGSLRIDNCQSATTIDFSALTGSVVDIGASFLTSFAGTLSFPLVTRVQSFTANEGAMTHISLPALLLCFADFQTLSNPSLLTISAAVLGDIGGTLSCISNDIMTSFSMPSLATFSGGGDCLINNNAALSTLNISGLQTVGGILDLSSNGGAIALTMNSLTSCGSIALAGGGYTSLSIAGGCTFLGGIFGASCTALASVSLAGAVFTDGNNYDFSNAAIPAGNSAAGTGINGILFVAANNSTLGPATTISVDGGSNAGLSALSAQGTADYTTLTGNGVTVNINP